MRAHKGQTRTVKEADALIIWQGLLSSSSDLVTKKKLDKNVSCFAAEKETCRYE